MPETQKLQRDGSAVANATACYSAEERISIVQVV
jgi:hypothetical protein